MSMLLFAILGAVGVAAQDASPTPNLSGVISEAAGIASLFGTPTKSSSSATSTTTSAAVSSTASPSHTSASAAATSTAAALPSTGGIDPHTRAIILGVTIPVGLILLGVSIGLCVCICLRRRRRNRRRRDPASIEPARQDWSHGDSSHHGYVPSGSDPSSTSLNRNPTIPAVAHHDSTPLMSEREHDHTGLAAVHPAYRSDSYGAHSRNINATNPFTPNPPMSRKPVPSGSHHGSEALAAGALGAGIGAAAAHHRNSGEHFRQDRSPRRSMGPGFANEEPHAPSHTSDPADYDRAPTPFGLGAMASSSPRRSHGDIEPSMVAHHAEPVYAPDVETPTEHQRRSLHERDGLLFNDASALERTPQRNTFDSSAHDYSPHALPRPSLARGYNNSDSATSNESWASAPAPPSVQQAPVKPDYWEDSRYYLPQESHVPMDRSSDVPLIGSQPVWQDSSRYSGDSFYSRSMDNPRRYYGADGSPRRSYGPDGKPRRLRFSDVQPEEYRYDETNPVGQAL